MSRSQNTPNTTNSNTPPTPPRIPPTTPPPPPPPAPPSSSSTLPPSTNEWIVFRETFLVYFGPDKRETIRAVGDVMFTQVVSGDRYRPSEPWTHARLRALVLDLQFAAQYLAEISEEPYESEPADDDEDRLAREAIGWSEEVFRVAQSIEDSVDKGPGSGEEDE